MLEEFLGSVRLFPSPIGGDNYICEFQVKIIEIKNSENISLKI